MSRSALDADFLCGILDSITVTITSVDAEGTILFVNEAAARNLSGSRDSIVGKCLYDFFSERAATASRERIRQTLEQRQVQRFEAVVTLPDGSERHFDSAYCPAIDRSGAVVSVQIVAQDVTELRRFTQPRESPAAMWGLVTDDLSMTAERLMAVLENAPIVICVLDTDMVIRYVNRVAGGVDINQIIGSSALRWLTEDSQRVARVAYANTLAGAHGVELEYETVHGNKWHARLAPLFHDGQVTQVLSCNLDVTEMRRLESQLWQAQKLESLGTLAGGIAHDFNNLLSAIMGNAGLVRRWLDTGRNPCSFLTNIDDAARKAADLCEQMLTYAGQRQPAPGCADLNQVIEDLTRLTRAAVSAKIRTHYELAKTLPLVRCNETQLGQVVLNLISNAADAIGDHHGCVTISTEAIDFGGEPGLYVPRMPPPGRCVRLRVIDTGGGIDAATLPLIFDPFYSTKSGGHGLGLSAVLGIVSAHDAAITVDSSPGSGTTMTVLFPVYEAGALDHQPPIPEQRQTSDGQGTILVVDDEPSVRTTAAIILADAGYTVAQAEDGDHAIEVLASLEPPPRAIVLDVTMPKRDGYSTLRELRKTHPKVPVLLSSGKALNPALIKDDACVIALRKPYDLVQLATAVAEAIRGGDPQ